jgi:cell division initiation protein
MTMTPLSIREQRFSIKFRGFDVKQVDDVLQSVADRLEALENEIAHYKELLSARDKELSELRDHMAVLKAVSSKAKNAVNEIQQKAEKEAEIIISKAELTAEKILLNAHNRLAQLHEDITELKRQRTHFEVKLRAFIEAQLKFLDMEKESNRDLDDFEEKIRFIKRP